MTPKLRALLVGGIIGIIAGVSAIIYVPAANTTVAQLVDAGVVQDFTPRRLACTVLIDGGYKEFRPIVAVSKTLNDGGTRDTIWPRAAMHFRDKIADANANCRVIATLTWAQVADFEADVATDPGSCACWRQDAGQNCLQSDGGTSVRNAHNEFQPDDWVGGGCVPKPCGEIFGASNWPVQCVR